MLRKIIKCSIYTLNQDYINKYGYCVHVEKIHILYLCMCVCVYLLWYIHALHTTTEKKVEEEEENNVLCP